ncbi:phage holin [Pectobacteriaceae bacterium C52]|uniref:Lysis protein n=1 Tax=Serratia sp. (strain ATCC 39006) TaxID=104623 RepID=V3SXQ5_SERS3|nr:MULTISPECIES: phage holin [Enterobacterales]WJV61018.1 phage holin [Pectobacteriaceae bacterium C52]AUG99734.1 lysis protein [Serratia sp. ATCC 39006]AUH00875.1 lysis protein [Serratia sp. ATCC 39006]AUH04053.1 lysis protein [Serratia sp. ATCC 39006]AUH05197.1 lysis protein [Serratia sp. ATCC 39006]
MIKMPEKITTAGAYSSSGLLIALGKFFDWFHHIDWSQAAVIIGIVVAIATYFTNVYFQRRQTRAIEAAASLGKTIIRGD